MPTYTVHEAKTNLSKLIERAERGEEVIIARGDKPAARLTAATEPAKKKGRRFGAYKGIVPELKLWNCEVDGGTEDDKASAR
jgi:prevent-host-death family protein